jgi:predicted O-methyltransferase YrrM
MDARIEEILAEYDERAARETGLFAAGWDRDERRDQLLLRVGPETGRLINILAAGSGATRLLELGTSYGYSTVWLAEAAQRTDGNVLSLDLAASKQAYARDRLGRAGLLGRVELITGDALEILGGLPGPFDFVLIDLWKDLYVPCLELIAPKLSPGAILVADNMLRPEAARADAEAYRARVRAYPDMQTVLLHVGSGIEVSRYAPQD